MSAYPTYNAGPCCHYSLIRSGICLLILIAAVSGCGPSDQTPDVSSAPPTNKAEISYFGFRSDGCKPSFGLHLNLINGVITSGHVCVMHANYPENREGQAAPMTNLERDGNQLHYKFVLENAGQQIEYCHTLIMIYHDEKQVQVQFRDGESEGFSQPLVLPVGPAPVFVNR